MDAFGSLQGWLTLIIGVLALGVQVFALVDALRQRTDAFPAAGKLTKPLWLTILGVATAIGVIFVTAPFNFFALIALPWCCDVALRPVLRFVRVPSHSRHLRTG